MKMQKTNKSFCLILMFILTFLSFSLLTNCDDEVVHNPSYITNISQTVAYGDYITAEIKFPNVNSQLMAEFFNPVTSLWMTAPQTLYYLPSGNVSLAIPSDGVIEEENELTNYKIRIMTISPSNVSYWTESDEFGFTSTIDYFLASDDDGELEFTCNDLYDQFFKELPFNDCEDCSVKTPPTQDDLLEYGSFLSIKNDNTLTYTVKFAIEDASTSPQFDDAVVSCSIAGTWDFVYRNKTTYMVVDDLSVVEGSFSVAGCNEGSNDISSDTETTREFANEVLSSLGRELAIIDFNFDDQIVESNIPLAMTQIPKNLVEAMQSTINELWDYDGDNSTEDGPQPRFNSYYSATTFHWSSLDNPYTNP